MRIEVVILGLFAVVVSTIALLSWRRNRKISRLIAVLTAQCDQAESEKASLIQALSAGDAEADERTARLEHDVKSPLGVILGFSALVRESLEHDPRAVVPLKNISAIHQAATKILQIVDAAVKGRNSHEGQATISNGKT
jgi:signal transduction histidine kinase